MRKRSLPQPEERTERRISAATSLSICALTVIAQIVLTLALTQLLAEKISYVFHSGAGWRRGGDLGVSAPRQPLL